MPLTKEQFTHLDMVYKKNIMDYIMVQIDELETREKVFGKEKQQEDILYVAINYSVNAYYGLFNDKYDVFEEHITDCKKLLNQALEAALFETDALNTLEYDSGTKVKKAVGESESARILGLRMKQVQDNYASAVKQHKMWIEMKPDGWMRQPQKKVKKGKKKKAGRRR